MTRDPATLADALLDGDLPSAEWQALRAADPAGFDQALAGARAQRAALAALPRPALPEALRARILAAAATPHQVPAAANPASAQGRRWWQTALPIALAAGLALAILLPALRQRQTLPPAPAAVARQEQGVALGQTRSEPGAESRQFAAPDPEVASEAAVEPVAISRSPRPANAPSAAMADQQRADASPDASAAAPATVPATSAAKPSASARLPAAQDASAPGSGPIALQLAWIASSPRRRAMALDERKSLPVAANRAGAEPSATSVAGASAPPPVARAPEPQPPHEKSAGEGMTESAETEDGPGRELLITLRNQTVGDLRVAPGAIRLIGVTRDGHAVWRTILRGGTETVIPADRSLSWTQPLAVLPPGIASLRLEVDGQRSIEIAP